MPVETTLPSGFNPVQTLLMIPHERLRAREVGRRAHRSLRRRVHENDGTPSLRIGIPDLATVSEHAIAVASELAHRRMESFMCARRGIHRGDTVPTPSDDEACAGGDQSSDCRSLCLEEVDERRPMRPHKRAPGHRALPARGNAVFLQNPSNRESAHVMSEILQGALDARIIPRRVFRRHPHGERPNLRVHTRATGAATGVHPWADDQFTMPTEKRIG